MFPAAFGNSSLSVECWSLLKLQTLGERVAPRHGKAPHLLVGERGEFEALFFLRRQGYQVVERRWRAPELRGDVDLIGWDGKFVCLVEVKTRTERDMTPAAAAIDDAKRNMLRKMARAYRRTLPRRPDGPTPMRFDVVSVYLARGGVECELIRGAFPLNSSSGWNADRESGV